MNQKFSFNLKKLSKIFSEKEENLKLSNIIQKKKPIKRHHIACYSYYFWIPSSFHHLIPIHTSDSALPKIAEWEITIAAKRKLQLSWVHFGKEIGRRQSWKKQCFVYWHSGSVLMDTLSHCTCLVSVFT